MKVADPRGGVWKIERRWLTRDVPWHADRPQVAVVAATRQLVHLGGLAAALIDAVIDHARGAPWVIEAELQALRRERHRWEVVGWRESRRRMRGIAAALAQGRDPAGAAEATPADGH
jgi:hypothetical protein